MPNATNKPKQTKPEQTASSKSNKPANSTTSDTNAIAERVVREKMKPRGKPGPTIGDTGIQLRQGEASRNAQIIREVISWPEIDKTDVSALEERLVIYLSFCAEHDIKIGNQMCYLALGITKDDVYNWEHGNSRGDTHGDFAKKIRKICAGNREILMQDGQINPITGIFWQKNYDGMRDVQDVVITPNQPLGDVTDAKELADRYATDIPSDT